MAKPKVPNAPSIPGADGRHYLNPAFYGFPDPEGSAAAILERITEIRARAREFQRELSSKRARIQELKRQGYQSSVEAFVEGSNEFADISEIGALEIDVRDLEERVRAAKTATETLAGRFSEVQTENLELYKQVLVRQEHELMDEYAKVEQKLLAIQERWRQHAMLVEGITGERQSLDYVSPKRPIMTKDPDDVVIDSSRAGAIVG